MSEAVSLLHNMSAPPKSVVNYTGLRRVRVKNRTKSESGEEFGVALAFRLPPYVRSTFAARLIEVIGEGRGKGSPESRLLRLIEDRARDLPIPDGAVVIPVQSDHQTLWPDALAAIAVITKSSENVWLRGKTPRLSVLRNRREISLLIPPAFATKLEEMTQ